MSHTNKGVFFRYILLLIFLLVGCANAEVTREETEERTLLQAPENETEAFLFEDEHITTDEEASLEIKENVEFEQSPMIYFSDQLYYKSPAKLDLDPKVLVECGSVTSSISSTEIPKKEGESNRNIVGASIYESGGNLILKIGEEYVLYSSDMHRFTGVIVENKREKGQYAILIEADDEEIASYKRIRFYVEEIDPEIWVKGMKVEVICEEMFQETLPPIGSLIALERIVE